ncbi:hypothetical protein, partial [Alkalihalobacillus alcalophilus]
MLKKMTTLFVLGIAALTMVACSNDEVSEDKPNEEKNNSSLEEIIEEPVVEMKEDEMNMSAGVTEETRNAFIKSIIVPESSYVVETNNGNVQVEIEKGKYKGMEISFLNIQSSYQLNETAEIMRMENAVPGKEIMVETIDINKYDLEFGFYYYTELEDYAYHRLGTLIIQVNIPHNIDLEEGRQVAHAIINSAQ